MPSTSNAVTDTLTDVPAVADAGAEATKCVAAPGETAIAPVVPIIDEVTVSVAVMVKLPTVFIVAGKFPSPLVRVEFPGSDGAPPVLLNWTVPV